MPTGLPDNIQQGFRTPFTGFRTASYELLN